MTRASAPSPASLAPFRLSETDFARFCELVREKSGLVVTAQRRPDLERAVGLALAASGLADVGAYYQLLMDPVRGRAASEALMAALTVGETHFFRNQPQFEALATTILPELIARRRAAGQRHLRLWSAGCASGEEPYSLAILLERLVPDLASWDITLLATDINPQALAKAQRGRYTRWSFREVPAAIQAGYFTERDGQLEIAARFHERVTFAYLNLVADAYPSPTSNTQAMDMILCRNVMIYFNLETIARVTQQMYAALVDDGWLILGHTEPQQAIYREFTVHNFPGTVVYRKLVPAPAPPRRPLVTRPLKPAPRPPASAGRPGVTGSLRRTAPLTPAAAPAAPPPPAAVAPPLASPPPAAVTPPLASPPAPEKSPAYAAAMALWEAGRVNEALPLLEALAVLPVDEGQAARCVAVTYANRLQLDQAEKWIGLALQRNPLLASAHYLHGLILQETGRPDEALAALRRCVYVDPDFVLGYFALVGLHTQQRQPERARKALENVSRLLAGVPRTDLIAGGDGLTAGRLLELTAVRRELL